MSGDKPFVQDPVVAKYYREEFLGELIKKHGLTKKAEPTSNAATFAFYYGVEKFPAELEQFLRMRDEYEFVFQTLGEWRIFGREVWLPDPAKGNLAEQIIELDQGNYHGPCILEYSAGCIYLGTTGNGDAYFAAVGPDSDNAEVYFYDHETFDLDKPIADSISSLAYANHLLAMVEEPEDDSEATSLKNVAEAFERIKDRVSLSWHYRSLEEAAGAEGGYDGSDNARWLYYRSLWINYLLRNDGVHKLSDVAEAFGFIDHNEYDLERALTLPHLGSLPQTAFYWLWRLFFFDKDETLRRVIKITKASANPVVRDMALLVEELQNGRKELGSIKDIHALREKFLKLDLDPDRAEEREREKQEAALLAAEQKAADEKRVAEMLATRSNNELVALAWEHVDNEVIVKPIYDRLRASEPDLAADCARIEFYFKGGFHRNDEGDDVLEALGQTGDARLAPFLLNRGECNIFEAAAHMDGARALARIAPSLDTREEYHHELRDAVHAVGVMKACGLADKLIAMIEEFSYAPGEFPYDVENKKVLWRLFEALAALRDPRAVAPIAEIAASGREDLAARALTSLGRLGDASAVDVLLQALSGPFMRPALFGLSQIGDVRAIEPVAALLGKRLGAPELLVYERLMLDDLRSCCGLPVALDNARLALKVIEANKYECMELHETAIGLLARCLDRRALAPLVRQFLDAEHKTVRYAARKALGTNGELAPVTYYDRPTVDAIFAKEGAEGLRAALSDPQGALRHNIARKAIAENLGADLEVELVAYGRELLAFEHYAYRYVRDKWERKCEALGLIASMGGEAADRLAYDALTHPNLMMQEPFQYRADAVKERARRFGPLERRRAAPEPGKAVALSVEPLGKTRWSLGGMINGVQFSADGERLIAVCGQAGAGGAASVFNRDGEEILPLPAVRGWAYDVDIHPDGQIAAIAMHGGHLLLIDVSTGETLADLRGPGGGPGGVRKARFSPDGVLLASASDDETLIIWDVASRSVIRRIEDKFDVNTVDWFPDGRRVVFGTDKQVGVADVLDESAEIRRVDLNGVAEVRVFASGSRVAAGGASKKGIVVFDERLEVVRTFDQRHVARIRFSNDESQMFAISWEGEHLARRWNVATGEATTLPGHDDAALFALDLDPITGEPYAGGGTSYADGGKNVVISWDSNGQPREANSNAHDSKVACVIALGDDEIASAANGSVTRWSLKEQAPLMTRRFARTDGSPMRFRAVAASPDRSVLLATGFDGAVALQAEDGAELWRQPALKRSEVVLGVEGAFIVGSDQVLVWLDAQKGQSLHVESLGGDRWAEHLLPLTGARAIAAASRASQLSLYDLSAPRRLASIELPARREKAEIRRIAAGGGKLVVSRSDASFDVFDAETLRRHFEAHNGVYANPMAVSADGALVACGEDELLLFDAETFDLCARQPLGGEITALCFVGARHLIAGLGNGHIVFIRID